MSVEDRELWETSRQEFIGQKEATARTEMMDLTLAKAQLEARLEKVSRRLAAARARLNRHKGTGL